MPTYQDFEQLDIRVGKIIGVEMLPNAKYTTHKLTLDFGPEIGIKISGARLVRYSKEELMGKLVVGVLNFPKKQIGTLFSEVLTLGVPGNDGECVLLTPEPKDQAVIGGKMY